MQSFFNHKIGHQTKHKCCLLFLFIFVSFITHYLLSRNKRPLRLFPPKHRPPFSSQPVIISVTWPIHFVPFSQPPDFIIFVFFHANPSSYCKALRTEFPTHSTQKTCKTNILFLVINFQSFIIYPLAIRLSRTLFSFLSLNKKLRSLYRSHRAVSPLFHPVTMCKWLLSFSLHIQLAIFPP